MRIKKLLCLTLTAAMIGTTAACGSSAVIDPAADSQVEQAASTEAGEEDQAASEEIKPEDISVTWEDSRVYSKVTLGNYQEVVTYGVKGYEDVPFMLASDYLNIMFEGKEKISTEDGVMKIAVNGTEAAIDSKEDTVCFENSARFAGHGVVDGPTVSQEEYDVVTPSKKNESSQTEITPLTVSLKDYSLPVIAYEDDILMPFMALQNVFGGITSTNVLVYNGKDYYNCAESNMYVANSEDMSLEDSPYMKAMYNGPFSKKAETSQAYADYGYNATCLLLDLTYGHKEEKNISSFDEYFTRMNAKKAMSSTDPSVAATAEMLLFQYLFDSGHDSVVANRTVFGTIDPSNVDGVIEDIKESDEGQDLFDEGQAITEDTGIGDAIIGSLLEKGFKLPEVVPLIAWTIYFDNVRAKDYGTERIDYTDDTAVIYFNSFLHDYTRNPSYYLAPVTKDDESLSNFAFLYDCFNDIKKHKEVKNVVINICDNGGGYAAGLIGVLGFLSKDGEVKFTNMDMLTGSYREEYYHVDTNLDGVADDKDGYGGQYDFYIMTSGSSYSCANALPYYAQKEGLAKIIGTNPGGGDCVVGTFVDAYGYFCVYSGSKKLGTMEGKKFVSDEKATKVDLNMMPSIGDITEVPWYDPEGIADAVHQYQNGSKTIKYNNKSDEEKIGDLILNLLGHVEEEKKKKNKAKQDQAQTSEASTEK